MENSEDKKKEGPGFGAYGLAALFSGLVYWLLGRWLKKHDIDLQKEGFVLYILLLVAAWVVGLVLMVLTYVVWIVYRMVDSF